MVNHNSEPQQIRRSNRSYWGRQIRLVLKLTLISYTLVAILLGFFQRKLLYRPAKAQSLPVSADRELMQLFPDSMDLHLTCSNGTKIRGWWLHHDVSQASEATPSDARRPLILYFHGNAQHRGTRGPWYQLFAEVGADVLAVDYPGYGDSGGKMTEAGMYLSCDAAWNYATGSLNYTPSEIIVAGTSLGGAGAVYLASQKKSEHDKPAALVVMSTFSSMVDTAASLYPWLPTSALLMDRYPSDKRIPKVRCPIVILHGDRDQLVSQQLGLKLFEAAPATSECGFAKRWVSLDGVGHNGLVRLAADQIRPEFASLIQTVMQQR